MDGLLLVLTVIGLLAAIGVAAAVVLVICAFVLLMLIGAAGALARGLRAVRRPPPSPSAGDTRLREIYRESEAGRTRARGTGR